MLGCGSQKGSQDMPMCCGLLGLCCQSRNGNRHWLGWRMPNASHCWWSGPAKGMCLQEHHPMGFPSTLGTHPKWIQAGSKTTAGKTQQQDPAHLYSNLGREKLVESPQNAPLAPWVSASD